MIDADKAVFIDFCSKCNTHNWCTKHNEGRYLGFYNIFKEEIEKEYPDLIVYGNTHPIANKEIPAPLGGFEIIFRKCRIFSKLKSGQWPTVKPVLVIIKEVLEGKYPPGSDFIDYHQIPLDGKKRPFYTPAPAPIKIEKPEIPKSTGRRVPGSYNDASSNYFSNQTSKTRISLPSASATPRRKIVSYNNIDKRPNTSQMPYLNTGRHIQISQANQAQSATLGPLPTVKVSQYYIGKETGERRGSAPDIEHPDSMQDMRHPSILIPVTNNTYLVASEHKNLSTTGRNTGLTIESNTGLSLNEEMLGKMKTQMDQIFDSTKPQTAPSKFYQRYVVIEQTKDREINQETVFSQPRDNDALVEASLKKGGPKLLWFPDCQRTNASPDRIGLRENFEEKIAPLVRQDSMKKGDGSPSHNNYKKTPDKRMSKKNVTNVNASPAKSVANLKKMVYDEEKLSQIKIPRGKTTKKKITLLPDQEKNCKIEIFCSLTRLIAMNSNEISVPKGQPLKIPLRFEGREEEVANDIFIFILKDGKPWQKINVNPVYA